QMDFGRKAGLRAPHRLGDLAAGRTGRVLMNPRTGAVDHQIFVVAFRDADRDQQRLPKAIPSPAPERGVNALPWTKRGRKIPPRRSGPQYPQDRLDAQALVGAFAATPPRTAQIAPTAVN